MTSSVEGKLGKPGIPGYFATKHAVNGLVKAAAHEVGRSASRSMPCCRASSRPTSSARPVLTRPSRWASARYDTMISMFTEESAIKRPNTVEEVAAVAVLLAS